MNIPILEKIGLTEGEIKVYLALLKLGETTAGPIVDESRVTRSKIYDILERLKQKGMVSYITKESTKYFCAAKPSTLLDYLSNKEQEIIKDKESISEIIPQLESQYKKKLENKVAEVYLGINGKSNA